MRNRTLRYACAIAALMAPYAARAEPGLPDADVVAAALDAHPGVQAAQARTTAARAEANALARGVHEFTVSGSYVRRSVDREGRYSEYDGQLTRAIRLPGKARLDRDIGRHGIDAAENRAEDARHQAALQLAQVWWEWLGAAEEARVDGQAVENYRVLQNAVGRRVALRDAAQLEADQTEAALGAARLAAAQSAGRETLARARLAAQFPGLPLPDSAPEVPRPELPVLGIDKLGEMIVARSHEIAAAEAEAQKSASMADRARAERMADPSVGLRLFSERGGAERGAGVLFSMPLGGGHRRAMAERASAEAGAAQADARAVRFAVNEMAAADMAEARFRHQAWQRAREGLDAQVAALVKLRRGQQAGEIDLSDVLLGERQVHDAFRAEAAARADAQRVLTRIRIDAHELWISE